MKLPRFFGTLTALLFIGMWLYLLPLKPSILCLQFSFSEAAFMSVIKQWSPLAVMRFKAHFAVDFMFLTCYGLFGYLLSARTRTFVSFSKPAKSFLTWAMPLAAVADACENFIELHLVTAVGDLPPQMYIASGSASTLKWLFLGVFLASWSYAYFKNAGFQVTRNFIT